MTAIVWDRIEDRQYETGIERGVIYADSGAYAWNGLISVVESPSRDSKVYYHDGVKSLIRLVAPGYKAKISAFTYPDVLDQLQGKQYIAPGVNLHDQREGKFHLSYRTKIGNALDDNAGYKLHLIYGLVINPSDTTAATVSDQPAAAIFDWDVEGMQTLYDTLVVNHISIDSREVDPTWLANLETTIYGTDTVDATLPDLAAVLASL
jgi:hypothetical protein